MIVFLPKSQFSFHISLTIMSLKNIFFYKKNNLRAIFSEIHPDYNIGFDIAEGELE